MIGSAKGSASRPQRKSHEVARIPAPVGGINTRQAIGSGDMRHCIYTYNLCPYEYGMRVRRGYREWQVAVEQTLASTLGVHTIIPFDSVAESTVGNRIFAVTNEGIWNVTDYDTTPVQMVVFGDQSAEAGYGTFTHYVDQGERDVLFYADSVNGLYSYDAATLLWTNTGILSGGVLAESEVKFVTSHKNNVWFAKTDSTVGYYLPILASSGVPTAAYFGDKFAHGGSVAGLFSWSVDGGQGVDDIFVVVSRAGDVIVYTGSGPEAADWGMKGIYYIGNIPNTPRFGTEQGGELYLLSAYGVTSLNDLLQGVDTTLLIAGAEGTSMAYKVSGIIRDMMKDTIDEKGWEISLIPTEGGLLISTPQIGNDAHIQFYYNRSTLGWGMWRGVPMECFAEFSDAVYFGTADGRIMKMDVDVDNLLINPPVPELAGDDIEFSILTAYSSLGQDGIYKRVKIVRPDFLANLPPSHSTVIRYDFDTAEGVAFALKNPLIYPVGLWDVSSWDLAVWGSSAGTTYPTVGGAWGYGRYVAIATKGASRSSTRLIGWDLVYDIGGPML